MANTYGTWLPGDPRGFRTRDHREHVEGDYKNPPPAGKYEGLHEQSKRRMKRPPVTLPVDVRRPAVDAILHALVTVHVVEVLAVCVGGQHMHVLARFGRVMPKSEASKPTASRRGLRETDPPRYFVGIAKERSAKALAVAGLVAEGGIWAKRGKVVPIKDRAHQVYVLQYILDHALEGAAVWSFREAVPPPPPPLPPGARLGTQKPTA